MSDPTRSLVDLHGPRDISRRLHTEVARLGARLADVLDASGVGRLGAIENAAAFLRGMADSVQDGSPDASGDRDPLDRLVADLQLTDAERMLVLLAGMPEEHEGYGTVLRAIHPRGEPRASVGLAAQC